MLNNGMEKKSLTKNFIYNYIRTFCNIAFPLITFMYTSRILGAEGIGKFNFSKSVITYFAMIAMLGINQYGTREADRKLLSYVIAARNCLSLHMKFL